MDDKGNWTNLYRIELLKDNWFRKLFITSPVKPIIAVWFLFGIIPAILFFITSKLDNSFYIEGQRGLIQDYIFLSYYVFIPALINVALVNFPKLSEVLYSLEEVIITEKAILNFNNRKASISKMNKDCLKEDDFNSLLKTYEAKIIGEKWTNVIKYLMMGGGLCYVLFIGARAHWFAMETYGMDIWSSRNYPISFYTRTFYEAIIFGLIFPVIIYKFLAILYTMKDICKKLTKMKVLRIRPVNPDRAGGLGELGKYSFKMVILLIPPILPILTYIFFGNVNIVFIFGLSLYIPLLVFTFFYPLSGAHRAMRESKKRELKILSLEFNKIYDSFIMDIEKNHIHELPSDFEMLEKLDELYAKAESMPVWPFDTITITKFGSLLGALALSFWLNWVFGKMLEM